MNAVFLFGCARRIGPLALAAFALCGCGRMGPLEPPPNPNAPPPQASGAASPADQALTPQIKAKIPPITPPQRSFGLDPLLK